MNAPYTGGFDPGAQLFAVDGDFTIDTPMGLPNVSYPLMGDSIFSNRDIVYLYPTQADYELVPLGTFPNLQPWSANQRAAILEQDFMVAQSAYQPFPLNTPYDISWSSGWQGSVDLSFFYLTKEGEQQDMGGGIVKIKRTFAALPPTRNEVEQFAYNFVGYADEQSGTNRDPITINVLSRIQYDYFIFDDDEILDLALFPNGPRLDSTTGLYPNNFILQPQFYFANSDGIAQRIFVTSLDDGDGSDPTTVTVPSFTGYTSAIADGAEIIAEGSTLTRWMGNIFERRTRFVLAQ
jgi:hypothetical protein